MNLIDPPLSGREVVLDCETTGLTVDTLRPERSDRIVEIGCFELIDRRPTGRFLQFYINPERDVPSEVVAIHGLTYTFLKTQKIFAEVAQPIQDFLKDSTLVIHNAGFDMKFLSFEFQKIGFPPLTNSVVDTVLLARKKFPGAQVNLDALCRRFQIKLSHRTKHGALIDAELLGRVYIELMGGAQPGFGFAAQTVSTKKAPHSISGKLYPRRSPLKPTEEEADAHEALLKTLQKFA